MQVAYQRILQLTYVDELLAALKTLFVKLFQPFLATFVASLHAASSGKLASNPGQAATTWNFTNAFEGWDDVFDKLLRGLEDKAAQVSFQPRCNMLSLLTGTRTEGRVLAMSLAPPSIQVRRPTIPARVRIPQIVERPLPC